MLTVTILRGLPASGKSTWAREQVSNAPVNSIKRVNKDDMRQMLDNGHYSKGSEKLVLAMRDELITLALAQGAHVIVDDTNLVPHHETNIRLLVKSITDITGRQVTVQVKDFDLGPKECIKRDALRDNPVGEKVIMDMYNRYLKKDRNVAYREHVHIDSCIICDIDGTLARMQGRSPYDTSKVGEDAVQPHIASILDVYAQDGTVVILVSGRDGEAYDDTVTWLEEHDIAYDYMFMRNAGDLRCDTVIKREIFEEQIEPHWDVQFVLDDRDRVVNMWREELNIPCLQVAYGDF